MVVLTETEVAATAYSGWWRWWWRWRAHGDEGAGMCVWGKQQEARCWGGTVGSHGGIQEVEFLMRMKIEGRRHEPVTWGYDRM